MHLKKICWRIHRNPLFWDIGLSTTFFFSQFFCSKNYGQRKQRGETKLQILFVLKDSTLSPGPDLRLFDSGSAWSRPVTAGVCGDMLEGGAGVATDALMRQVLSAPAPWRGGSQIGTLGAPFGKVVDGYVASIIWIIWTKLGHYIWKYGDCLSHVIYVGDLTSTGFRSCGLKVIISRNFGGTWGDLD